MSYIYSQALAAAFSRACPSDTRRSALLSGNHTPKPCLWHDKTMAPSRLSRFGMTCKLLVESRGAELLTWFVVASRAKTYPLLETVQELTESAAECGDTWPGLLAKYDPTTSSWKTAQHSLLGGLDEFSETWPRWGLMHAGECWELPASALRTSGSGSGLWQTPVADDAVNRVAGKWNSRGEPKLSAQVMFPTPCANSHTGAGHGPNKKGAPNLQTVVAQMTWPTPTVCGNYNRKGASATSGDGLATAVKTWPTATATATAYKGWSPNHNRANTDDRLDYSVEREAFQHGQQTPPMRLNPDWCEWLMGWPIGHTALKPLGTDKFREWRQQHSPC